MRNLRNIIKRIISKIVKSNMIIVPLMDKFISNVVFEWILDDLKKEIKGLREDLEQFRDETKSVLSSHRKELDVAEAYFIKEYGCGGYCAGPDSPKHGKVCDKEVQ